MTMTAEPITAETTKATIIRSLRGAADFLERECVGDVFDSPLSVGGMLAWFRFEDKQAFQQAISGKGPLTKNITGQNTFTMRRHIGQFFIDFDIQRELICTKRVERRVVPAEPERLLPSQPERTVEEITWDCPDSILKPHDEPVEQSLVEVSNV